MRTHTPHAPTKRPPTLDERIVYARGWAGLAIAARALKRAGAPAKGLAPRFGARIRPWTMDRGEAHIIGRTLALPVLSELDTAEADPTHVWLVEVVTTEHARSLDTDGVSREAGERALALSRVALPHTSKPASTRAIARATLEALDAGAAVPTLLRTTGVERRHGHFAQWQSTHVDNNVSHGISALTVLGNAHPAHCAPAVWTNAARAALPARLGDVANASAVRYAIGRALQRAWAPVWRDWMASLADAGTHRALSTLRGAPRWDHNAPPALGLALLRFEDGGPKAASRRRRFAERYPLFTEAWLFGAPDADAAIAAGAPDEAVFAHLLESLHAPPWPRRAMALGRGQTTRRLSGPGRTERQALRVADAVCAALHLAPRDAPRSRRAWKRVREAGAIARRGWRASVCLGDTNDDRAALARHREAVMREALALRDQLAEVSDKPLCAALRARTGEQPASNPLVRWRTIERECDAVVRTLTRIMRASLERAGGERKDSATIVEPAHRALRESACTLAKTVRIAKRADSAARRAERAGAHIRREATTPAWISPPACDGARALVTYADVVDDALMYGHCLASTQARIMIGCSPLIHVYHIDADPRSPAHADVTVAIGEHDNRGLFMVHDRHYAGDAEPAEVDPRITALIMQMTRARETGAYDPSEARKAREDAAVALAPYEEWAERIHDDVLWKSAAKLLPVLKPWESPDAWARAMLAKANAHEGETTS